MGRPRRQARVHGTVAVRHPGANRTRPQCAGGEIQLCPGRSGHRRLAARIGCARCDVDLYRLGKLAAALAVRGFARGRLGRAQSERGRDRRAQEEGFLRGGGEPESIQSRCSRRQGGRAAVLLQLQRRTRSAGSRRLRDAQHHREARRRVGRHRSDLRADCQGHEGLPEARRRNPRPISCPSIPGSRSGCARRASGIRNGTPRSRRASLPTVTRRQIGGKSVRGRAG